MTDEYHKGKDRGMGRWKKGEGWVERICPTCGTSFLVARHRLRIQPTPFCSNVCGNRNRPPKQSFASIDELRRLYVDEGMTLQEIGSRFGVTLQAVWHHLDSAGIPRRKGGTDRPMTEEHLANLRASVRRGDRNSRYLHLPEEAISEYEAGASVEMIGARHSINSASVAKKLRESGVVMRRNGFTGGWRAAKDGHLVQSGWEVIVDDWLFDHGIGHEIHPVLPFGKKQRADFLVGDRFIEVWGVVHNAAYEAKRQAKVVNCRSHGLTLIEITPVQIMAGDFSALAELLQ